MCKNKTKTVCLQRRLQRSAQGATAVSMLLPRPLRRLANFFQRGGGRWVRGTVIVSTELIWRMKGQNGETAGESDRYHGFIVMHYISMLEKQKG